MATGSKANEDAIKARIAEAEEEAPPAELFPNTEIQLPAELLQQTSSDTGAITNYADDGIDHSRELDETDVVFPRVKLTQGQSRAAQAEENAVPQGNWHYTSGNENLGRSIKVVFMDMYKTRSLWIKDVGRMCASMNFVQGVGQPGIRCADCSLKNWTEVDGNRKPPACSVNYNYMALVIPDPEFLLNSGADEDMASFTALMLFARSGAKVAKEFNSKKAQIKKDPWYKWMYTLDRKSSKGGGGNSYWEPVITKVERTPKEYADQCIEFLGEYSDEDLAANIRRTITADDAALSDDDD